MKALGYSCRDLFERNGFKFYNSHYNINLFGIRRNNPELNRFDDYMFIEFADYSKRQQNIFKMKCTTVPGDDFLEESILNPNGTFILLPSTSKYGRQYKFKTGVLHHGKYECLGERKPVIGLRDNNCDGLLTLDYENKDRLFEDTYGTIHIHHAGKASTLVDRWSAGCQVISGMSDWNNFWYHIKKSEEFYGKNFTYTLFTEDDLNEEEKLILL